MKLSLRKGFSFGLTSGIITTLGLIVGLHSSTRSDVAVIGGILVIAIADAMSDAFGVHISEEAEDKHSNKEIWESTGATFISKFFFALTFAVPILIFNLGMAIIISVLWGLLLISVFSFYMARVQNTSVLRVVGEHLTLAVLVIIVSYFVGEWIARVF